MRSDTFTASADQMADLGVVLAVGMVLRVELVVRLSPPALQQNPLVGAAADTGRVSAVLHVPLAIALAIARYRLWAIDSLIHRTLVYGMLTASVVGLYVLLVGTLGTLLSGHSDVFIYSFLQRGWTREIEPVLSEAQACPEGTPGAPPDSVRPAVAQRAPRPAYVWSNCCEGCFSSARGR